MNYNQPPQYNNNNNNNGYNGYNGYNNPQHPGNGMNYQTAAWNSNEAFATSPVTGKSRGVAALLAIFLGSLGIHYFYCGKTTAGVVFLASTLCTCGILGAITGILSLISGIIILCGTNQEFDNKYVLSTTTFPI